MSRLRPTGPSANAEWRSRIRRSSCRPPLLFPHDQFRSTHWEPDMQYKEFFLLGRKNALKEKKSLYSWPATPF